MRTDRAARRAGGCRRTSVRPASHAASIGRSSSSASLSIARRIGWELGAFDHARPEAARRRRHGAPGRHRRERASAARVEIVRLAHERLRLHGPPVGRRGDRGHAARACRSRRAAGSAHPEAEREPLARRDRVGRSCRRGRPPAPSTRVNSAAMNRSGRVTLRRRPASQSATASSPPGARCAPPRTRTVLANTANGSAAERVDLREQRWMVARGTPASRRPVPRARGRAATPADRRESRRPDRPAKPGAGRSRRSRPPPSAEPARARRHRPTRPRGEAAPRALRDVAALRIRRAP